MPKKKEQTIEVCRSFSRKYNLGNYETLDYFASAKAEVSLKEAGKKSEELIKFCEDEVMKSIYAYKMEHLPEPETPKPVYTKKPNYRQNWAKAKAEAPKSQAEQEQKESEHEQQREEEAGK